jgi:hypothetical protein
MQVTQDSCRMSIGFLMSRAADWVRSIAIVGPTADIRAQSSHADAWNLPIPLQLQTPEPLAIMTIAINSPIAI